MRTLLWTTVRAYQRGMIASPQCPYCRSPDETERNILWECPQWATTRDLHKHVLAPAGKVAELPPFDSWPPCLKLSGLLPEVEAQVNR